MGGQHRTMLRQLRCCTLAARSWAQTRRPSAVGRSLSQQAAAESHRFAPSDKLRRKLIYRSKQRGWLEMDLILGDWASQRLQEMSQPELEQFEIILDLENPDLFKWLTGQTKVPDELDSALFVELRDHVKEQFINVPVPRGVEEWSSRKWWSDEITEEMRQKME